MEIYERAGVRVYLIFDQPFSEKGRFRMTGYRLAAGRRYRRIEPDAQGRLLSESTDLLFAVADDARTLVVTDATTGELLRTGPQEAQARKAAEAEIARLRADLSRRDKSS